MKNHCIPYFLLVLLLSAFFARSLSGAVIVTGTIQSDTTWTNNDTILVTGYVTVNSGVKLSIEPGTVILFYSNATLKFYGTLAANGEFDRRIVFSFIADTIGGSPGTGTWPGLRFLPGSTATLEHCDVRYAQYGLTCEQSVVELYGCLVENFQHFGAYMTGSNTASPAPVCFENSVVRQTHPDRIGKGTGINLYGSIDAEIIGCSISGCNYGVQIIASYANAPAFRISDCEIRDHSLYGIRMSYG